MKQIKTKSGDIIIISISEQIPINRPDGIILGKLSELTDKDCEEFVEFNFPFDGQYIKIYKNYYYVPLEPWDTTPWYNSSKESFISLLQSESVDTTNEDKLLIIKLL